LNTPKEEDMFCPWTPIGIHQTILENLQENNISTLERKQCMINPKKS